MWTDPIDSKYLLVINIPQYKNADGTFSVDQLWHKDLQLHRYYLRDLRLASLTNPFPGPSTTRVLEDEPGMGRLTHVELPNPSSIFQAVLAVPRTFLGLWKAVGEAEVVHVGVGGWPYPLGWPAALFAKIRKKFLIVVVESAPWRLGLEPVASIKRKFLGHLYETMARWSVNQADASIFTQAEYRSSLLCSERPGLVTNATWIDEDVVLTDEAADLAWNAKPISPLKLIFAGRVTDHKGITPLLDAIKSLASSGVRVHVDIMGQGDRLDACKELAETLRGETTIGFVDPVPYGVPFFEVIRRYHAVLVPSLADEQPRIIYDAYAQAVPVIASDTAGIRDCATDGKTGILLPVGDAVALATAIARASGTLDMLREMGMQSLKIARKKTHAEMHRARHAFFKKLLGSIRPSERISQEGGSLQPSEVGY